MIQAGALPVFAEIDESFNIDPGDIEAQITPQTKVIMAVHLQGNPADMDPILAWRSKHSLKVLEDCSQSVGASYKGKPAGLDGRHRDLQPAAEQDHHGGRRRRGGDQRPVPVRARRAASTMSRCGKRFSQRSCASCRG